MQSQNHNTHVPDMQSTTENSTPPELKGVSCAGKISTEETLIKEHDGYQRTSQGVYVSANDPAKRWYVKECRNKEEALREVVAGNYFRFLAGDAHAPETRLLKSGDNYYVMSELLPLNELTSSSRPNELEKMILMSYVIDDVDCRPLNLKVVNGNALRIDFGAALLSSSNNDPMLPFITGIRDLSVRFDPQPFRDILQPEAFVAAVQQLNEKNLAAFPWRDWAALSDNPEEVAAYQKLAENRARQFCSHILDPASGSSAANAPDERLIRFYRAWMDEKVKKGDVIFHQISPEILAARHKEYFDEHKEHPKFFTDRLFLAHERSKRSPQDKEHADEFDEFFAANFPAKEFGIKIPTIIPDVSNLMPTRESAPSPIMHSWAVLFSSLGNTGKDKGAKTLLKDDPGNPKESGKKLYKQ